jgi:glutathione peroxidase
MIHSYAIRACLSALLVGAAVLAPVHAIAAADPATLTPGCAPLLQHSFLRLQDEKPQSLCQYSGKVLVVVNTASFCGFTPQMSAWKPCTPAIKTGGWWCWAFHPTTFRRKPAATRTLPIFVKTPLV